MRSVDTPVVLSVTDASRTQWTICEPNCKKYIHVLSVKWIFLQSEIRKPYTNCCAMRSQIEFEFEMTILLLFNCVGYFEINFDSLFIIHAVNETVCLWNPFLLSVISIIF